MDNLEANFMKDNIMLRIIEFQLETTRVWKVKAHFKKNPPFI